MTLTLTLTLHLQAEVKLAKAVRDAAQAGDAQAVAAWLDEGGGVDARCAERQDTTLLISAAYGGQKAVVRMLLQRGASVNLQESSLGSTALMHATANGHITTVQALLDAKADISLQAEGGNTALMYAEQCEHTATAQLLRQHAKRPTAEAEAKVMHAAATAPTPKGRGVRIFGLKPTPNAVLTLTLTLALTPVSYTHLRAHET